MASNSVLSIVIRTVDQATARINAINKRIDAITKPTRDLSEAFGKLAEKSGLNATIEGVKGVGSAVGDLLGKVAMVGGAVAAAVVGVMSLVDGFAVLGHTAERAGVEVDFLAGMRYAAQKAGVPVDALDEGIVTLTQNIGQASAGTGRMLKFLTAVSPVLAKQVVAAQSTQEVIGLLADAMAKIPDATRRAALAQKTFGNSAFALVVGKGSGAIMEQMAAYAKLAGSQEAAVKASLEVESSMVDLKATTDGLKAKLVTGLAPALKIIIDKLATWFTEHSADIEQWAKQIGDELPGAVDHVVKAIRGAIDDVSGFVDKIGGIKVAAVLAAGVLAGPLLSALVTLSATLITTVLPQIIAFSMALLASPAGPFIAALALIGIALAGFDKSVMDSKEKADEFFGQWGIKTVEPLTKVVKRQADEISRSAENVSFLQGMQAPPIELPAFAPPQQTFAQAAQATIKVDFANAPKGLRVTADPRNTATVDMSVGSQMFGGSW